MPIYTTYFDSRFLVRGAACLRSLLAHAREPAELYVLALDEQCARHLPDLLGPMPAGSTLTIDTLETFETRHPELTNVEADRSRVEYIFTLTPFLCRTALARAAPGQVAVYLDADTFFFADPGIALDWMAEAEIGLTEHRFPPTTQHLARTYGRFNVGWLGFRHGSAAFSCLDRWATQCLASCSMDPFAGSFGDQKYLDDWPAQFHGVQILGSPGLNAAPWNASQYHFASTPGGVTADGDPLLLFHFHRLTRHRPRVYETDYRDYGALSPELREHVYLPYLATLDELWRHHQEILPPATHASSQGSLPRRIGRRILAAGRLFSRRRVIFSEGRVLSPLRGMVHV